MLRSLLKPAALLTIGCFLNLTTFAQGTKKNQQKIITKDETVIIKTPDAGGRTVIEIKDGTVYVNGRSIMSVLDADATHVHKKIIVENGPQAQALPFNSWGKDDTPIFPDQRAFEGAPHAVLGVMTKDATGRQGAVVKEILPGSAAASAELQKGDIITRVDGKIIADAAALFDAIRMQHQPGDEVAIRYERIGREYNIKARLGKAHAAERAYSAPQEFFRNRPFERWDPFSDGPADSPKPRLGVSVEDRAEGPGVQVLQVRLGSAAAQAGLQGEDIITRMDGRSINSVSDLQAAVNNLQPGKPATIHLLRKGQEMDVRVEIPKPLHQKDL